MTHLSKIFIDKDGPTANPYMEFPEKPIIVIDESAPRIAMTRTMVDSAKEYQQALSKWHQGRIFFESPEEVMLLVDKQSNETYSIKPNTFIDVDLEVEVVEQWNDGVSDDWFDDPTRTNLVRRTVLRIVDKKQPDDDYYKKNSIFPGTGVGIEKP